MLRVLSLVCLALFGAISVLAAPSPVTLVEKYVFTDEKAVLQLADAPADVAFSVKTITPQGWGPKAEGKAKPVNGKFSIPPLTEGIHIITLKLATPVEVRFLAIAPPAPLAKKAVQAALPRSAKKLFSQEKFVVLAMGDSVTNTGDFAGMLVFLLKRATGNPNITLINRSYPGRSVDATVRFFPDDALATHPDLGVLMYGLNDQGAGCPLDGYVGQYRWIAERLAADCHADTVFLQPTPDIPIPVNPAERTAESAPVYYTFRTIGFAESLRPLAAELKVPLAETFQAIWGKGGASLEEAVKAMWPLYPPGYSEQFKSMLETDGKGDTIHPNALGHLRMAQATYEAIRNETKPAPALTFTAVSEWTPQGVVSHVRARNASGMARTGTLAVYPQLNGELTSTAGAYTLEPGKEYAFDVTWPQATKPEDLLLFPNDTFLAPGKPLIPVVDTAQGGNRVYCVTAPFVVKANFVRERQVVTGNTVKVTMQDGKRTRTQTVTIPTDAEVGRIPLVEKITAGKQTGWAVAELAYVRYGGALAGEAQVDGDLGEWANHTAWFPLGEHVQARFTRGIVDERATPQECYLRWATKAGKDGIYFGVKATGQLQQDSFTLFFDTREPKLLGTPGRYYWASGSFKEKGVIGLDRGETSQKATGMKGAWKTTEDGATFELFIPYDLVELAAWPTAGDLGLSIWWRHTGPEGKSTTLQWSEDSHPWNTRWYGVVRLDNSKPLPYMVRVK